MLSSVEVRGPDTTTNHEREHCRLVGGRLKKEQRLTKRGRTVLMRRMNKEEEDDDNEEENDCAPLPLLLPQTQATTTGHHASSATTASAQAVTAVAAARCSGLGWGVGRSSSSKQNAVIDTCFFCVVLVRKLNVCYTWHRMQNFQGSFTQDSGRITDSGGFRNKFILP